MKSIRISDIFKKLRITVVAMVISYCCTVLLALAYLIVTGGLPESDPIVVILIPLAFFATPLIGPFYFEVLFVPLFGFILIVAIMPVYVKGFFSLKVQVPIVLVWLLYGLYCFGRIGSVT